MLPQENPDHVSVRQMVQGWLQEIVDVANAVAQGCGYALLVLALVVLVSYLCFGGGH